MSKKRIYKRTDGMPVTVKENGRDNPSCPDCGHYNALLAEPGDLDTLKCRDCGTKVRVEYVELGEDEPDRSPVTTMDEYLTKYGTESTGLLVGEFLTRAPDFPGGLEIAKHLGVMMADLKSALRDYQRKARQ